MEPVYARIRTVARRIAAELPPPAFYRVHLEAIESSQRQYEQDPVTRTLKSFVLQHLDEDLGHGLRHAEKVSLDAGALMIVAAGTRVRSPTQLALRVRLVQSAGLLHDIQRKHRNHAREGAVYARKVLGDFGFESGQIEDISRAIRNHEAFRAPVPARGSRGALVSDCLYDADKFRWGPDNFTDTVWDMISFHNPPLADFIKHYPRGMQGIEKIKMTFRTATGKMYGPQFIDLGLSIGNTLYDTILTEFESTLG